MNSSKLFLPNIELALPGRDKAISMTQPHYVTHRSLLDSSEWQQGGLVPIQFGMGCFWGAEKLFWPLEGVHVTAVGYAGGVTKNPNYEEVCSGQTGHTEVVLVVFDPCVIKLEKLLKVFWEGHVPTFGMRQGNDIGTQYRSAIYVESEEYLVEVRNSFSRYQMALWNKGLGGITTELGMNVPFYYAEEQHQQYLAKNPQGYACGLSVEKTGLPEYRF